MAPSTDTYWVIDDSGSMSSYSRVVREQVSRLVEAQTSDCSGRHFFICFSTAPRAGTVLSFMPVAGGSTDICPAFSLLNEQLLTNMPLPQKVVVVFISDGEDNQRNTIVSRLKACGGPTAIPDLTCVLFTVAVGSGFPTQMVCDALRPNFHAASDYLPLVFPLNSPTECMEVFSQLNFYMTEVDHNMGAPTVDEHSSQQDIERAASAIYNCHVVRAAREQDKAKVVTILDDAKTQLEAIAQVLRDRDARNTSLEAAKQVDSIKPLVSRLLQKYKQERRSGLTITLDLITKLNQLRNEAVEGRVLSRLSDAELAQALGYGNTAGRYLAKSAKYHSAEFARTKSSLLDYLRQYTPEQAAHDELVADYLINQAEAILDAQANAADIEASSIGSVIALVDVLALVCRTLKVRTCDGTQINPWLLQVEAMPAVMKTMNSVDFFQQHSGQYNDPHRQETANCLLPITANPASILSQYVGLHLTTFFLVKNEALCFPQSLAALVAAVATFCLDRPQPLPGWVQGELDQALTTYECVYERGPRPKPTGVSHKYLTRLASDQRSTCLQTESAADPDIKCEHLTKAVLGLLLLLRRKKRAAAAAGGAEAEGAQAQAEAPAEAPAQEEEGSPTSVGPKLREMMISFMAEMVGRSIDRSKPLIAYLPTPAMKASAEELVKSVDSQRAMCAYTLPQALTLFSEDVASSITRSHPQAGVAGSLSECLQGLTDLGVSCHQFSERSVTSIFASLDALHGNAAPQGAFELSPEERLAILAHALHYSTSAERCANKVAAVDLEELEQMFVGAHIRKVSIAAEDFIREAYTRQCTDIHSALPMTFPLSFTTRLKEETGHDLEVSLGINPETRLPRCACSVRGCRGFLRTVTPSSTAKGAPCISSELLNHLAPIGVPVAYVRTLAAGCTTADSPEVVAQKAFACSEMLPCEAEAKSRAVRAFAAWWSRVEPRERERLSPAGDAVQQPDASAVPPLLVQMVEADMALLADPEGRWGGYEAFKHEVTSVMNI